MSSNRASLDVSLALRASGSRVQSFNLLRIFRYGLLVLVIHASVFILVSQLYFKQHTQGRLMPRIIRPTTTNRIKRSGNMDANETILRKIEGFRRSESGGKTRRNNTTTLFCKLPKLDPYHETVLPYMKKLGELNCGKSFSKFVNNTLTVEGDGISTVRHYIIKRPPGDDFSSALSDPVIVERNLEMSSPNKMQLIKPGRRGCISHRKSKKCLHPFGGVRKPDSGVKVVFHRDCCIERIKFKMEPTGLIRHVDSGLCIHGDAGNRTEVTLDSKCTTVFTVSVEGVLRVAGSKMCLHQQSNRADETPINDERLILSTNCTTAFDFRISNGYFKGTAKVNSDFIRVDISQPGKEDTVEVHMNTAPKPEVLKRRVEPAGIPVSIAMIMFDSTSAANFKRKMKKTNEYLKRLPTVFLKGETIVGDGTTAQLAAMLTGIAEKDQPEARRKMPNSKPCDNWRFIFRDFAKRGYATMYSEDSPASGTFNYRLKGFKNPPTDHYGRYFWFEADKYIHNVHCAGSERYHVLAMRYFLSLFRTYRKNPKFAFLLFSSLTHDDLNSLGHADSDLVELLRNMENESILNSTIVFIFGDHGLRFGPLRMTLQGKLEERLPHMSVTFPKWFPKTFPRLYKTFQQNGELLTTPFDIYATLQHILSYPLSPKGIKTGQSLFTSIDPQKRTCAASGVEDHWCPCLNFEKISVTDPVITNITDFTLEHINNLLGSDSEVKRLCHELKLKEIKNALQDLPNEQMLTFETTFADDRCDSCGVKAGQKAANTLSNDALYQIQFTTSPNNGFFEASIKMKNGKPAIMGEISRVDAFGHQPDCIANTYVHLIKFCYCKK